MFSTFFKKLSSPFKKSGNFFFEIQRITQVPPKNISFYELAFRHSSASKESNGTKYNNQRLEYLGDAILGAIVADYLYQAYPDSDEGFLTNMRSKIVSRKHLNQLGIDLGLNKLVVKKTSKTVQAKSIYGDALEALVGALYLDRGYQACQTFVSRAIMVDHVDLQRLESRVSSHKGALLEWGQKTKTSILFEITGCWGKSHSRKYQVSLKVDGQLVATGSGSSKKKAEEEASKLAYGSIVN